VQSEELKNIISSRGKTQEDVANYLNMSPRTFTRKLSNGNFGAVDIDKMIDYLDIKEPMWVFFDRKVTLKDTKIIEYNKY